MIYLEGSFYLSSYIITDARIFSRYNITLFRIVFFYRLLRRRRIRIFFSRTLFLNHHSSDQGVGYDIQILYLIRHLCCSAPSCSFSKSVNSLRVKLSLFTFLLVFLIFLLEAWLYLHQQPRISWCTRVRIHKELWPSMQIQLPFSILWITLACN